MAFIIIQFLYRDILQVWMFRDNALQSLGAMTERVLLSMQEGREWGTSRLGEDEE